MSAKGTGKRPPVPLDQYFTPMWMLEQLVEHVLPRVRTFPPKTIIEPSAGTGNIVWAMRGCYPDAIIAAVEIDKSLHPIQLAHVSCEGSYEEFFAEYTAPPVDLVVGNPPFSYAKNHAEFSIAMAKTTVLLVRQGFMASGARAKWFNAHQPSHVFMIPNRPQFGVPAAYLEKYPEKEFGKWGSDSADYAWVCWSDYHDGPTELRWLPSMTKEQRHV